MTGDPACFACLRRTWLLGRMAGHLEHHRAQISGVLAIEDLELISALGGERRVGLLAEYGRFTGVDAQAMLDEADERGLEVICRHGFCSPAALEDLGAATPATLHVASASGRLAALAAGTTVAIVGARKPSAAGLDMAHELGRALAAAGVTVISGMALGVDSAAHEGALAGGGATIAVLPGPADRAYPVSRSRLYGRIRAEGAVISEVPLGSGAYRWAMIARNRIIAALSHLTVVVEAATRSGALTTLAGARELARMTAAVPGPVRAHLAAGTNHAIAKQGASLIRGPQDVLDLLFGEGIVDVRPPALPELTETEAAVLARIDRGVTNIAQLGPDALAPLSGLELKGWVRRGPGGGLTSKNR